MSVSSQVIKLEVAYVIYVRPNTCTVYMEMYYLHTGHTTLSNQISRSGSPVSAITIQLLQLLLHATPTICQTWSMLSSETLHSTHGSLGFQVKSEILAVCPPWINWRGSDRVNLRSPLVPVTGNQNFYEHQQSLHVHMHTSRREFMSPHNRSCERFEHHGNMVKRMRIPTTPP